MNLVIGSSSQLAKYFPSDYIKISSRNIDFNYLKNNTWDCIYITFAEQRIYNSDIDYVEPNYIYTLKIINSLLDKCNKIVFYTSCELWNDLSGKITIETPAKFFPLNNEYCISKLLLWNKILELRKNNTNYNKIVIIHPFYFNSVYRQEYFLFGKIFNSILNNKKIKTGSLDFYRDMVHTNFVVKKSIEAINDTVVGSGKLFNVREFIKDLYKINKMDFNLFVEEDLSIKFPNKQKLIMADVKWEYSYENLLEDTQNDLLKFKEKK